MTEIIYLNLISSSTYLLNRRVLERSGGFQHCLLFTTYIPLETHPFIEVLKEEYDFRYRYQFISDLRHWLDRCCPGRYYDWPRFSVITFQEQADAMMTKLTWA